MYARRLAAYPEANNSLCLLNRLAVRLCWNKFDCAGNWIFRSTRDGSRSKVLTGMKRGMRFSHIKIAMVPSAHLSATI